MKDPLKDYARNVADLQRIPLFNPRFREVYGVTGILAILLVAGGVFALGLKWLAPWNPGYISSERSNIWAGVVVMPLAGLLVGSYVVEFALKGGHVVAWSARRELVVDWRAQAFGAGAILLLLPGIALAIAGQTSDLYGYLLVGLSAPLAYWFVTFAWKTTDERRRSDRAPNPPRTTAPEPGSRTGPGCISPSP